MRQRRLRSTFVAALAAALTLTPAGIASADPPAPDSNVVNIVDKDATPQTRSLFSFLSSTRGQQVLYGAQHTTNYGKTFASAEPDSTQSDVLGAVGDYPAIFGMDTLSLEGFERPGVRGESLTQNAAHMVTNIQTVGRLGGIPEISAHMSNFVTGGNFGDTSEKAVNRILPGGDKNASFNLYLDAIAAVANGSTDSDGTLIPIIFRPFHENTGGWFWWGAGHATTGEFKELFRYTVEYLRDTREVHNMLYAFSPNGFLEGDEARYLTTYPGDEWVDILGYDVYENSNDPENSDAYINSAVKDLAMISRIADEHGKIPGFTELGRTGERIIKPTDNKSLNFFTDLLAGIKADPDASRIAFMSSWANQGGISVPYAAYTDADGVAQPANELLPDFQAFHADPFTAFAADIPADAFTRDVAAAPAQPTLRLVSPADGVRVITPQTRVRVKATASVPTRVWFTVGDDAQEHDLALGADGYHSATWNIGQEALTNETVQVTVHATYATGDPMESASSIILGEAPVLPPGVVDDFEGYGDDAAVQAAYAYNNAPASTLTLGDGVADSTGAQFAYDFSSRDYQGFGKALVGDQQNWSDFTRLGLWLQPDGSDQKLVLQINAGGQTFEAYPSLAGTDASTLSINFSDFRPPPWDSKNKDKRLTEERLKAVTQFYVYINKTDSYITPGSIGLDNLQALADEPEPTPSATPSASPTATVAPTATATATATATVTVTPTPPSGGDVYTTPGYHSVNGRKWFTTCEPYSATWRCTTEIWATQVTFTGGKFEKSTGWFFNNLTYLPVRRATWAGNPLASTGQWTSTEGRQWRTECDTAATGGNGCRSYIRAKVVQASQRPDGYSYAVAQKWVLNNIVLFS